MEFHPSKAEHDPSIHLAFSLPLLLFCCVDHLLVHRRGSAVGGQIEMLPPDAGDGPKSSFCPVHKALASPRRQSQFARVRLACAGLNSA